MAASILGRKQTGIVTMGQNGRKLQWGQFAFSTTDATGTIPVQMHQVESVILTPAQAPATAKQFIDSGDLGTVNATATFLLKMKQAGTISALSFLVSTTVATDAANIWTVGVVNKGAAGAGTAVVVNSATAANSNNATGGAAFTAYTPRALTLTGTAADLVVAAGDVLEVTFTKASSAADLVDLSVEVQASTLAPDEILYWADTLGSNGYYQVPSTGLITIGRLGTSKTSGLKGSYLAIGK